MPLAPRDSQNFLDHMIQGAGRDNLVAGATSQERLYGLQMTQYKGKFVGGLSIRVVGSGAKALNKDGGGSTEQYNVVELRIELPLIRRASAQE